MGGEALALDVDRARALAAACLDVAGVAGRLAHEVETLLGRNQQSRRAGRLLAEVDQELGLLSRVIDASSDQVEAADRWTIPGLLDVASARLVAAFNQELLRLSLGDTMGEQAIVLGAFELSDSFRRMDPVEWRLATTAPGCRSFGEGRYYAGGGALRGPDGRLYPVVVPHLVTADGHFTIDSDLSATTASVASLGGGDPGWTMVGYETGVERIVEEPNVWWRALTWLAVATGLGVTPGVDDANLSGVHFRAGSRPNFSGSVPAPAPTEPIDGDALTGLEPMVLLAIDGRVGEYPIADATTVVPDPGQLGSVPRPISTSLGKANTADNLLALATGAMTGFVAARDLDHRNHRAYEVIFEENADGRLRSRVQTFTLEQGPAGLALYGWHLFLDADGELQQSPVSYQSEPVEIYGDALLAHNPLDPDFTQRVGGQAFGAIGD